MDGERKNLELSGLMTALVTPFRGGEVDFPALEALVERQIEGGVDWLVPLGTTGETPTLHDRERAEILERVLARANGRCPVMAGTGCNCTAETIKLTRAAQSAGAEAALIVTPYYNRPPQEGLFRHYAAVAEAVNLPIVLYNVPARTGVNLRNDVVVRLVERFPHIVAIKDATGSLSAATELLSNGRIAVLSGDDSMTWPFMSLGAVGVVSVLSNLLPELMKSLVEAARRGDMDAAHRLHEKVLAVADGIGRFGPNPIPIKTAMALAGLIEDEFRLPLCPMDDASRREVEQILRRYDCLETVFA